MPQGTATCFATDINPRAVTATRTTLAQHGVVAEARAVAACCSLPRVHLTLAQVVLTDLVDALEPRLTGTIDLLLFNPPYVPSPTDEVCEQRGAAPAAHERSSLATQVGGARLSAAWAGGARGRVVVDRFLARVPALLSPRGALYMVAVTDNDVPELLCCLHDMGLDARVCLERTADEERLHIISARRRVGM